MESTLEQLRWKEVIGSNNGIRYGFVNDLIIDLQNGCVKALVVPGAPRCFGLLSSREPRLIRWEDIRHIGEDIILVDGPAEQGRQRRERRRMF